MDVWYFSYGSNILVDRFLCYIHGGTPTGSTRAEVGCEDKTSPKETHEMSIPHPLYFSKERSKWGEGGVAFIDHQPVDNSETIGRVFLITENQFKDVIAQENNETTIDIDLQTIIKQGYAKVTDGWYGRVMYLGKKEGAPIFTFTSNTPMDEQKIKKPAKSYIKTITDGLMKMNMSKQDIGDYLSGKHGGVNPFQT